MTRSPGLIAAAIIFGATAELHAQWLDAQLPKGGELQVGLGGGNVTFDQRFRPDGSTEPLTSVFAADLDVRLVPALDSLDASLAGLFSALGLPTPAASTLGPVRYDALLETTRAPVSFTFGVTDWLAAFAVIPIVKGKSFVATQFDSLAASAGPAGSAFAGDPNAFFSGLADGIATLQAIVAADTLPPVRQAEAEALLSDASVLETGLIELGQGQYLPTDASAAGEALLGFYEGLRGGFLGFEIGLPVLSLAGTLDSEQAVALSSGTEFGIESPRSRSTGIKFGDIELGISIQPINTFRTRPGRPRAFFPVRARFDAIRRFPSGAAPRADQLMYLGTGDGQPDLEFRSTLDVGVGSRIWLSLFAAYNLQAESDLERLITAPESPIQRGAYTAPVRWDPGEVLTLAAAPRLNFTRTITFSGLFMFTRRDPDRVMPLDSLPADAAFLPADIERGTEFTARSFGFAARYASTDWSGDRRNGIPVEVEFSYLRNSSARDGLVPKQSVWQVALRYYQGLFR